MPPWTPDKPCGLSGERFSFGLRDFVTSSFEWIALRGNYQMRIAADRSHSDRNGFPIVDFSDAMIFAMAIANIIGLYMLMPKVKALLVDYKAKLASGEIKKMV